LKILEQSKSNTLLELLIDYLIKIQLRGMYTSSDIQFVDMLDLNDIQHIQDLFSDATGVASIITFPDGTPITRPSNFCRLCNEIIRKTEAGLLNCFKSDAEIGRPNPDGPVIRQCLSGGLWDAGASIVVGGKHVANWLIGQVRNDELDYQQMLQYAKTIGSDENDFMNALEEVPVMSKEKFEKVAQMLFAFVNEVSSKVYQNSERKQSELGRKQAEKELMQEKYFIDALLNYFPDHVYFKDLKSRFLRINRALAQVHGFDDPAKVVGMTDFDFFTAEHAQQAYDDEQRIIRTGQPLNKEEKETHPDRPDTWVSTIKMPLLNHEGEIIGTFGISRNITEQKNLENALLVKQLLLEGIIENIPDQVYYKDRNSKFVLCNTPVALLAGCTSEKDLIGKSDFDFYPANLAEQYFKDEQTLMEKGEKFLDHEEQILDKKTGEMRWNLSSKVPVKDGKGNVIGLAGVNRDITERKKAEEEINLKNELLQTINAEKDKFFSILAHDLRGPLSAFLSATQILSDEIQNMSLEEIKEITISMKDSASNIYGLLENLLEWSRLKRGLMEFNPEKIKLKQQTIACLEVLKESAQKKNIKIDCAVSDDIEIFADSHMLDTVIRNLVSNAIKFTPAGGNVMVKAEKRSDQSIEIKVIDSGIGMTPEMRSKLFLLNEKTSRKGTGGEPSTGLGLHLCKEFIVKHNGRIWVESNVDKGSTFSFTFDGLKI
jgi:PAS domain S-box-containing protein